MRLTIVAWTPEGVSAIPLWRRGRTIRAFSFVDDEDYERFGHLRWYLKRGYAARSTYPDSYKRAVTVRLHREILGLGKGRQPETDHRNHNKLDNRRSNLRSCTRSENMQNGSAHRNATSVHRGVYWHDQSKRWRANVKIGGRALTKHHATEEEAAKAARELRRLHMPFAVN